MNINPTAGWILTKEYTPKKTFTSPQQAIGDAQKSEIIAIGEQYTDDYGNLHTPDNDWKVGTIIIHGDNNNDFELDFDRYRFVHFSRVMGLLEL